MFKLSPRTIVIASAVCFSGLVILQFMWIKTAYQGEKALLAKEKKRFETDLQHSFNQNPQFKERLQKILNNLNGRQPLSNELRYQFIGHFSKAIDSIENISGRVGIENFGIVSNRFTTESSEPIVAIALAGEQDINRQTYTNAGKLCLHCVLDMNESEHSGYNYQLITIYSSERKMIYSRLGLLTGLSFPLLLLMGLLFGQILKRYRQEKKLSQSKNDFINHLSHEINTPVFAIQLANTLIREKSGNKDVYPLTAIIEKETAQLKEHAAKVLELASLENDAIELVRDKVDLNCVVEQKRITLEFMVKQKNGTLNVEYSDGPLLTALDTTHFNNIIVSVTDNALKYNDRVPVISIRTFNNKNCVGFSITDNGIGIGKKHLPFVTDKFYRVPQEEQHYPNGFGLGLNYVREVVRLHNGTITISSEEGKGSTVTIILPTINHAL